MSIAPIFFVPRIIRQPEEIIKCGKVYLWSVSILAVVGWLQLLLWYETGKDPLPIGFINSYIAGSAQQLRSGIDHVGSIAIYRMSSFGGEPKGLATGLALGLLILQTGISDISTINLSKQKAFLLWGFLMLSLLFTWSTSGIYLWLIGTIIPNAGRTRQYAEKTKSENIGYRAYFSHFSHCDYDSHYF